MTPSLVLEVDTSRAILRWITRRRTYMLGAPGERIVHGSLRHSGHGSPRAPAHHDRGHGLGIKSCSLPVRGEGFSAQLLPRKTLWSEKGCRGFLHNPSHMLCATYSWCSSPHAPAGRPGRHLFRARSAKDAGLVRWRRLKRDAGFLLTREGDASMLRLVGNHWCASCGV